MIIGRDLCIYWIVFHSTYFLSCAKMLLQISSDQIKHVKVELKRSRKPPVFIHVVCEVTEQCTSVIFSKQVKKWGHPEKFWKDPFPLCLDILTTVSLGYPVLSFVLSISLSQKHVSDWKPEIRIPHGSDYVMLNGLDWNTEYEVHVVAENQQGKSEPGILSVRTATEPTTIPGTIFIIPPRASTQQLQCTKASTVTKKALLFEYLTSTGCLFKACWLIWSDINNLCPSIVW